MIKSILIRVQHARAPQGGRRIEQASPIDHRSTKSRSSRFWKRLDEIARDMQNVLGNMYKTYRKYAGNGTKMNENRCPEASKEQVGGRTQCAKQRLKYLQKIPKIIENRSLEGSKSRKIVIWRGLRVLPGMFGAIRSEFSTKLGSRCAKLGARWHQVGPQMLHNGVKMGVLS